MKDTPDKKVTLKLIEEDEITPVPLNVEDDAKIARLDQEAPKQSKIYTPGVSEVGNKPEICSNPELDWGDKKKALPLGWIALTVLIFISLGVWCLITVLQAQSKTVASVEIIHDIQVEPIKEELEYSEAPKMMRECVQGYLAAKSIEEMLPYVRHAQRVLPLMEDHYQTHKINSSQFKDFPHKESIELDNLPFIYTQIKVKHGPLRELLIEPLSDGSYRVDWESDVCYQPMTWESFIKKRPVQATDLRVVIMPDHFYAYEFRDESQLQCYKLNVLGSDQHLFGFVHKSSQVATDIKKHFIKQHRYRGGFSEPMMLSLRFPEKTSSSRCVWIDKLLIRGWMFTSPPDPTSVTKPKQPVPEGQ